jgi:RNA polymerase I-specific transcription initiation factor RRN6
MVGMAGMSQGQELQNAHSTKSLNYGHLGTVMYDEEDRTWKTLRVFQPHFGSAHRNPEAEGHAQSAFPFRHLSSKIVYYGPRALEELVASQPNDGDPDVTDELDSGRSGASDSSANTTDKYGSKDDALGCDCSGLPSEHSPNRSELLAIGSAVPAAASRDDSELQYIPIFASVSGNNGQSVRLAMIEEEVIVSGSSHHRNSSVYVLSVSGDDHAIWTSNGGPVQQVCFAAATDYPSTWMAARLQSSTTIFHPLINRKQTRQFETSQFPLRMLPYSVLDANPIISIPISRTGGHAHADVTFHPQDHQRVGLVDEHGNWSVWLIDGDNQESLHSRFRASLISSGKLWIWDCEKRGRVSLPYHDGWHRIFWRIKSDPPSDELYVCNRRTVAVYNSSGNVLGLTNVRIGHARENQSILDVQPSKVAPGTCFVLTSSRLFWLHSSDAKIGKSTTTQDVPHVPLSWQHFRDHGDKTLHLVLLEAGMSTLESKSPQIADANVGSYDCAYSFPSC